MPSVKLNPNDISYAITGLEIAIGRQLFFYRLGGEELGSIILIEGYSKSHNCIYGRRIYERIQHYEKSIGTPIHGVPDPNAVCLVPSDFKGYEVYCTEP